MYSRLIAFTYESVLNGDILSRGLLVEIIVPVEFMRLLWSAWELFSSMGSWAPIWCPFVNAIWWLSLCSHALGRLRSDRNPYFARAVDQALYQARCLDVLYKRSEIIKRRWVALGQRD